MFNRHLRESLPLYFFVIAVFLVGFAAGVLALRNISPVQKEELVEHLDFFLSDFGSDLQYERNRMLRSAVFENLRLLGLVYSAGILVIGIPVVIVILFLRGFALGFTLAFLIEDMVLQGLFFSLLSILPQNIFFIPALLLAAAHALGFALGVIRKRPLGTRRLGEGFFGFTVLILCCALLVFAGAFVESHLSPYLIHIYTSYFI